MNWKVAENRRKMGDWLITEYAAVRKSDIIHISYQQGSIAARLLIRGKRELLSVLQPNIEQGDVEGYLEKIRKDLDGNWIIIQKSILIKKNYIKSITAAGSLTTRRHPLILDIFDLNCSLNICPGISFNKRELAIYMQDIIHTFQNQPDRGQWLISDLSIIAKSEINCLQVMPDTENENLALTCEVNGRDLAEITWLYHNLDQERATTLLQKHGQELSQIRMTKSAGKRKN